MKKKDVAAKLAYNLADGTISYLSGLIAFVMLVSVLRIEEESWFSSFLWFGDTTYVSETKFAIYKILLYSVVYFAIFGIARAGYLFAMKRLLAKKTTGNAVGPLPVDAAAAGDPDDAGEAGAEAAPPYSIV